MFKYTYTIKKEDINLGNHVGNERALLFFQWAREKFFESLNLSELNIGEDAGVIQTDAYVQYKKQLFLDQTIEIIIENVRVEGLKIIFEYKVMGNNEICIQGSTTLLAYDYSKQKVRKVPKNFLELI